MLSLPNFFTKPIQLRTSLYLFSLNSNSMAEEKHHHHHHVFHHNKDEDKPVWNCLLWDYYWLCYHWWRVQWVNHRRIWCHRHLHRWLQEGRKAPQASRAPWRVGCCRGWCLCLGNYYHRIYLLVFTMVRTPPPPLSLLTYLAI